MTEPATARHHGRMTDTDLQHLLAEHACERLVHQYARFVDRGEAARVAELFTPDGEWIAADGRSMDGQEAIRAGFAGRQAITRRLSRHVITNVLVDVHSDSEATGIAYLINYRHDADTDPPEKPGPARPPKFVGDYHFKFRRCDAGWRISSLRFDLVFLRPARSADAGSGTGTGTGRG
jgi:uncharacterized protein (TIGR02246 family)